MRHAFFLLLPFLAALVGCAGFAPQSPIVAALVVGLLCYSAGVLGSVWFPRTPRILGALATGTTILALQSVSLTSWYYLGGLLTPTVFATSTTIALLLAWGVALVWRTPAETEEDVDTGAPFAPADACFLLAGIAAATVVGVAAWHAGTAQSIRTPWPLLPHGTIAAITLLALATWGAAIRGHRVTTAALLALSAWSVTLLTPLIYQLGFGFDGFLHRASETVLLTSGTLSPKPPYYIGQYTLVTWIVQVFGIPLRWVDVYLVPLFSGLVFGLFTLALPRRRLAEAAALLTILPLGAMIATTPQSFAYLLGLLAITMAIATRTEQAHPAPAIALTVWALATHPLAGLPFACAVVAILLGMRSVFAWIAAISAGFIVPAAFYLLSKKTGLAITWNNGAEVRETLSNTVQQLAHPPASRVALWADAAVFFQWVLPLFTATAAIIACITDQRRRGEWLLLSVAGVSIVVAGAFLGSSGEFSFLISYERGDYAARLVTIGLIFLAFPASAWLGARASQGIKGSASVACALSLLIAGSVSARTYLALPRHDATVASHGWSVGRADLDAIRFIDREAGAAPYAVLANQTVSAAAVELLGFKRYVHDPASGQEIFFYPIPTGGPLYDVFLRATGQDPSRDTIKEAATLTQSERVYVVLNNYWWDVERVGMALASSTDAETSFGEGAVRVFRYDFNTSTSAAR